MPDKNLPGITTIAYRPASETEIYPKQIPSPGSVISVIGAYTNLPTVELSSCNISDERNDAGLIYTTKITGTLIDGQQATAAQRHILREMLHSYKITDVYGVSYLVGTNRKPYPEIFFSPAIEAQTSGQRAIPFEIIWKSTLPPLEIAAL